MSVKPEIKVASARFNAAVRAFYAAELEAQKCPTQENTQILSQAAHDWLISERLYATLLREALPEWAR